LIEFSRENSALQRGIGPRPGLTNRNPPMTRFWSNERVAAQRIEIAHWLYYLYVPVLPAWRCHRKGEGLLARIIHEGS